jgi:cob(I)alamin adenosyltransferase
VKTFNKKGDLGETSLLYGGRVPKNSPRPEAYGSVDEAMSALGLARALCKRARVKEIVYAVQKDLSILSAELATAPEHYDQLQKHGWVVTAEMVDKLEEWIDELEAQITMPNAFVIAGATAGSGALDLCRSIVRRAERGAVGLRRDNMIANDNVLAYLNRSADLLFTLARYEEAAPQVAPSGDW